MKCDHKWKITHGLYKSYKDCEKCGMKWEDREKSTEKIYVVDPKKFIYVKSTHLGLYYRANKSNEIVPFTEYEFTKDRTNAATEEHNKEVYPMVVGEEVVAGKVLIFSKNECFALYDLGSVKKENE